MEAQIQAGAVQAGGLVNQAFGMVIAMTSLRTVFEIGMQDMVPSEGTITAQKLAECSGAEANLIIRLLRPLVALGIFQETAAETYAHSPMSLAFKNPGLRAYMEIGWDMWLPVYGSLHTWFKQSQFKLSQDPAVTPFSSIYGDSLFQYLGKNPGQAAVFNASMEHLAYPVAKLFPFASRFNAETKSEGIERNVLVDVGGGKGQASREILVECPALEQSIVLQDQASVLEELPADLKDKLEMQAYTFFEPQPIKGAAFYYMRNILCDWPDDLCTRILNNQAVSMSKASRLLLATRIIPDAKVDSMTAAMDICMLTYGGAERTAKHLTSLLKAANLTPEKIWTTEQSSWGVIEAKLL